MESLQKKILAVGVVAVCLCGIYVPWKAAPIAPALAVADTSGGNFTNMGYAFIWSPPLDPYGRRTMEIDVLRVFIPMVLLVIVTAAAIWLTNLHGKEFDKC